MLNQEDFKSINYFLVDNKKLKKKSILSQIKKKYMNAKKSINKYINMWEKQ